MVGFFAAVILGACLAGLFFWLGFRFALPRYSASKHGGETRLGIATEPIFSGQPVVLNTEGAVIYPKTKGDLVRERIKEEYAARGEGVPHKELMDDPEDI